MAERITYPVGTASFQRIREDKSVYVDKTGYIDFMIKDKSVFYFLARPRRFGKSLFLDTLSHYFQAHRNLFKGLEIDKLQPEEWEKYPVLHFNMTGSNFQKPDDLQSRLSYQLGSYARELSIEYNRNEVPDNFEHLIKSVCEKTGKKVVILIDEYDAPLSSAIGKPELQESYREQLHGFYSVLKNLDNHIRFCMLTGVTRYGKVSVFSGLNNLNDITFDNRYAGICGITKEELHKYYKEGVRELAEKKGLTIDETFELLKFHYDGYHFSPCMLDIYNPFSINHAMQKSMISNYWCQSGVPTLLSKSLMHHDFNVERLRGMAVSEDELTNLSMHALSPVPLFYQTGYLTIKGYEERRRRFVMGYPNREVEEGILANILNVYAEGNRDRRHLVYDMEDAFEDGKPDVFVKILSSFLSSIPNTLHERVAKYENYYHTIFYCIATLMGLDVDAEYQTSEGNIDLLVKTEEYIYVIELKVNGTAKDAIRQIEEKHYCRPFESDPRKLYKIGLGFSKETHTIDSSIIE